MGLRHWNSDSKRKGWSTWIRLGRRSSRRPDFQLQLDVTLPSAPNPSMNRQGPGWSTQKRAALWRQTGREVNDHETHSDAWTRSSGAVSV